MEGKDEPPKEAVEGESAVLMGPRDWNYLFASGTTEVFAEGRDIVSAGAANEALYRVVQGMVKISEVDKKKKIVSEDSIFGEESGKKEKQTHGLGESFSCFKDAKTATFLTGSSVSKISVVAHTAVTVQLIDSASLAKMLLIEPQVGKARKRKRRRKTAICNRNRNSLFFVG